MHEDIKEWKTAHRCVAGDVTQPWLCDRPAGKGTNSESKICGITERNGVFKSDQSSDTPTKLESVPCSHGWYRYHVLTEHPHPVVNRRLSFFSCSSEHSIAMELDFNEISEPIMQCFREALYSQTCADPICSDIYPRHDIADDSKIFLVQTVTTLDCFVPIIAVIGG